MSRALKLVLAGLGLFVVSYVIAEIVYHGVEGWSAIDVIYMLIITVFGVGYGEVHPVESPELKFWTIVIIVTGCSSLILMGGGFVQFLLQEQFNIQFNKRKMADQIKKLKQHTIIVGYGRVGRLLVDDLMLAGDRFVVIDRNSALEDLLGSQKDAIPVLIGDATDEAVLVRAGIERAKAIAVVLPDDAQNVFITLSARALAPDINIIARGEKSNTASKLKQAGASHVVMPAKSGADHIAGIILQGETNVDLEKNREELDHCHLKLTYQLVEAGSPLIGKTALQVEQDEAFLITAIQRDEKTHRPLCDFVIAAGDRLSIVERKLKDDS